MERLWDAIGRTENDALRGDVRTIRDTQKDDKSVQLYRDEQEEKRSKAQDRNSQRIQILLALLSLLVGISAAGPHWSAIKALFTSAIRPFTIQHSEARSPYTATIYVQQDAGNSENYTRQTKEGK
jgi:hypothetical protein